jgi:putative tricarboxylic transport membrane protein
MLFGIPVSFGLGLLLAFGILGYLLRRFGYPIAPVVVGLILGPMAEKSLRQALQISQGDPSALFHSWIAVVLWLLALTAVLLPLWLRWRGRGRVLTQFATDED